MLSYGLAVCEEWTRRGYKDTCAEKMRELVGAESPDLPAWLGDESFHAAHRAALKAKNPAWYGQWGWTEEAKIAYIWPGRADYLCSRQSQTKP